MEGMGRNIENIIIVDMLCQHLYKPSIKQFTDHR